MTALLEILEQKEWQRGDRAIGSTRCQIQHVPVGKQYDVTVDFHQQSLDEIVGIIVSRVCR